MRRSTLLTLLGSPMLVALAVSLPASAQSAMTEQEARAIGVDAYLYFYPLSRWTSRASRSTNVEPGKEIGKGR